MIQETAANELEWLLGASRSPRRRTIREFAEQEIVLPTGPFQGRKFRCSRQPFSAILFDLFDSGDWWRHVTTGPSQSGKSLQATVIPTAYHLFEIGETVILAAPTMEIAVDKWEKDFAPVIKQTRYAELMPTTGAGSKGGEADSIEFRNGATLKFMSGGGSDKKRASFTSRVLVVTEMDGLDEVGGTSREADKLAQLLARLRAFSTRARFYGECTVSTAAGRTWREYQGGTQSRIATPCPHCKAWVSLEREHLHGWQEAENIVEARELARFHCSECGEAWSEDDRASANAGCKLVHRGQEITPEGEIVGDPPPTDTLGFRWSAVNNMFLTTGDFGADEWRAAKAPEINSDAAERELSQFVWAVPPRPSTQDAAPLEEVAITKRVLPLARGVLPATTRALTIGVDVGKWLLHWAAGAWQDGATGHVCEYSRTEVPTTELGVERGVMAALRELRDLFASWPRQPDRVMVDAGYMTEVVYAFCRESGARYLPFVGRGEGTQYRDRYHKPKSTGAIVQFVGEQYHLAQLAGSGVILCEANADAWKSWVHARFTVPTAAPGAMTLFEAPRSNDHLSYAKHLTAEKEVEEIAPGKGPVRKWERVRANNHWLDATYMMSVAAHLSGVRLFGSVSAPVSQQHQPQGPRFPTPDGRSFSILDR